MEVILDQELTLDVRQTAEALGKITKDETAFRLLIESCRAQDYEMFHELLSRFDLLDRSHLVCRWLYSKECALICFELCGPPPKDPPQLNLREFAELTAKISSSREILGSLAGAVLERDERAFKAGIEKLGVEHFRHYICNWICSVRCRLVCEIFSGQEKPAYLIGFTHLMEALQQASSAVTRLLKDPKTLAIVEKGVLERNCDMVRIALDRAGFQNICHWICHWICAWRCVRVCILLCRPYTPVQIEHELTEIHEFAHAVTSLATRPELVMKLVEAVITENKEVYSELVNKLGFERFCHQLCLWLCRLVCRRYCQCVCPPLRPRPWFTHVGCFNINGDINSLNGLTNRAIFGHGGLNYGFFGCLELRGFCPLNSPTSPGSTMRYRFLYERGGSRTALVGSLLYPVSVGNRTIFWDINGTGLEETTQTIWIAGSGATPDPTPSPVLPPGTPWGTPPDHIIVPDADGWITVDPNALGACFSDALIGFNTAVPFPDGDPAPGVAAGVSVPSANLKNGVDIAIIFEATRVGGPISPPDYSITLSRIHINNWNEVALLYLLQFHSGGGSNPCLPLSTELDVEYTTDHELMAAWDVSISSAAFSGVPPGVNWPSGPTLLNPRGEAKTFHLDISNWPMCSYTVSLTTRRALTTGLNDDVSRTTTKTFCIGRQLKK